MKHLSNSQRKSERGFTLTEVLVASAIFVVIFVAALLIYDRSNTVFKRGVESSDMQQNTRVGLEKMISDVRLAGFDYERNGIPSGSGGAVWQKAHGYGVGNFISPTVSNGFTFVCTQAGTSGNTEPNWGSPPTVGAITNDNTVKWRTKLGINQYQQPDEQIEYAHPHAITIRANFDFETHPPCTTYPGPNCANGREPNLEQPEFPVVTTSNQEIVTYVLKSDRATGVNNDTINFYADTPDRRAFPGGRSERLVQIRNVDLCTGANGCDKPPYTLYRVTLDDAGTPVPTPLASNIRSLDFTYYSDPAGSTLLNFKDTGNTTPASAAVGFTSADPASSGGGQYNPINPALSATIRAERAKIHSVRVAVTGMGDSPDGLYTNPTETAVPVINDANGIPVSKYRIGKIGLQEQQETPPGTPTLTKVCINACGFAYLEWQAPPPDPTVGTPDNYIVYYDTVLPPVKFQRTFSAVNAWIDGLVPGQQYYFQVKAINSFGPSQVSNSIPTSAPGVGVKNKTTPMDPPAPLATGFPVVSPVTAQNNQITVNWTLPTANVAGQDDYLCYQNVGSSTQQYGIAPGEITRWDVLRGTTPLFTSAQATLVSSLAANSPATIGLTTGSFVDLTAVPCVDYYYRIQGIKNSCFPATAANNVAPGVPNTTIVPAYGTSGTRALASASGNPAAPTNFINPLPPAPQSSFDGLTNTYTIYLQWFKSSTDDSTPPKPMVVQDYTITREKWKADATGNYTIVPGGTVTTNVTDTTPGTGVYATFTGANVPYYQDTAPGLDIDGLAFQYRYTVAATLPCSPVKTSVPSSEVRYPCPYVPLSGGASSIVVSVSNLLGTGDGTSIPKAWETNPSGSAVSVSGPGIVSAQVVLADLAGTAVIDLGTQSSGFTYPLATLDSGTVYRLYVVAKDTNGCQGIRLFYVQGGTTSGCCLEAFADNPFVVQYTQGTTDVTIFLNNSCTDPLVIQSNGIKIKYDPTLLPAATKVLSVDFPNATPAGSPINVAIADPATGTLPPLSVPGGARNPVGANSPTSSGSYAITLHFNNILTNVKSPLDSVNGSVCINYLRTGIDNAPGQFCKIVPRPSGSTDFNDPATCP